MKDKPKIAVAGGDPRMLAAANELRNDGFGVSVFGTQESGFAPGVPRARSLEEAAGGADAVVLGIPFSRDGKWINMHGAECAATLESLYEIMAPRGLLLGGVITPEAVASAARYGVRFIDYYASGEVAVLNAGPTAEGAIAVAMSELPVTVWRSKTAVVGGGSIARALVPRLIALGAEVTVFARDPAQRAFFASCGADADGIGDLDRADGLGVIFNTVPAVIFDGNRLRCVGNAVIIDLASAPGGVDTDAAREIGVRVIRASNLPGKVAPVTAGHIIKDSVVKLLRAEGVTA